jgi:hypothetical protein
MMPGFDEIKQVDAGVLNVGYVEAGPAEVTEVIMRALATIG